MKTHHLSATLMAFGLLMAAPAFAQTTTAQVQLAQEGGPSMRMPCGLPYNANPAGDPNCKQWTQNLAPTPRPGGH
jgi:hypothetical protein